MKEWRVACVCLFNKFSVCSLISLCDFFVVQNTVIYIKHFCVYALCIKFSPHSKHLLLVVCDWRAFFFFILQRLTRFKFRLTSHCWRKQGTSRRVSFADSARERGLEASGKAAPLPPRFVVIEWSFVVAGAYVSCMHVCTTYPLEQSFLSGNENSTLLPPLNTSCCLCLRTSVLHRSKRNKTDFTLCKRVTETNYLYNMPLN